MPVFTDGEPVAADEGIRRGTTVEKLAGLKPAFTDDGVIHAGNSSQISDGAAALLVMTAENAVQLGLTPLVRYRAGAVTGADPVLMLTGPIPATEKVLHKAGVGIDEVGVFEVNEAFAPVPLAWLAETGADETKLNPLGGAIALGHPLGASGAVLMTRMIHHMRDNGIRYGLQTMCEGGGTANARWSNSSPRNLHDRRRRAPRPVHRRPRGVPRAGARLRREGSGAALSRVGEGRPDAPRGVRADGRRSACSGWRSPRSTAAAACPTTATTS